MRNYQICRLNEEMVREATIKAKLEGKIEGKIEKSVEIATAMLKDGVQLDKVAMYSGLTLEEVTKLANELKK